MTCIIGYRRGGTTWIGGDSGGFDGYNVIVRADTKVFAKDGFVFGFTGSYRVGQLLRYSFDIPDPPRGRCDIMKYMVADFIEQLRECLKNGGAAGKKDDIEWGGDFLVGYKGHLFRIANDYQVGVSSASYDAVGAGYSYALGAMHVLDNEKINPDKIITRALKASAHFCAGMRGPYHIIKTNLR